MSMQTTAELSLETTPTILPTQSEQFEHFVNQLDT
jgi:hypothetical protein